MLNRFVCFAAALIMPSLVAQTSVSTTYSGPATVPILSGSTLYASSMAEFYPGRVTVRDAYPLAPLNVSAPALGTNVGDRTFILSLTNANGNGNALQFFQVRGPGHSNWYSSSTRIQNFTDGSAGPYIEFNPPGSPDGIAFGGGDTEVLRLLDGGVVRLPDGGVMQLLGGGKLGVGTASPYASVTIGSPAGDGSGSWTNGLLFTDTSSSEFEWSHAAIYSQGSTNYNGSLVFATDGDNNRNMQPSEKMRLTYDGKLGIRTSLPGYPLEVNGSIAMSAGSGGGIVYPDGSIQSSANSFKPTNGIVQFSNPTGEAGFQFNTNLGHQVIAGSFSGGGGNLWLQANDQTLGLDTGGILMLSGSHRGDNINRVNVSAGLDLPNVGITVDAQNRVGIGVIGTSANLSQALEVRGNIKIGGQGGGIIFNGPDLTPQTQPWTGTVPGGDYAESVDVTGDKQQYEAGDLLMIDADHPGQFLKVTSAYSSLVAGVYATRPGVIGRRQPFSKDKSTEVPMALVGIVPTKVSAENGPIRPGDLLVASSTPGYAMRGTDRERLLGAVIGKALAAAKGDKDLIEVLITLQ